MEHEMNPETPTTVAVAEAVSSVENCDPTALAPLYDVVDTDALDAMFDDGRDCSVSFVFEGHHVTIENGERIVVETEPSTSLARN